MPQKASREYRDMMLEIVKRAAEEGEADKMLVAGYASTFNEPYTLWEDKWDGLTFRYREQIDARAFDDADLSDVIMQYDHHGRVFARTSNNTLTVKPDEKGLHMEADLGGTELGRGLFEEIRGGYTDKMSFGFTVSSDEEVRTKDEDGNVDVLRTITGISKVYDVSAVSLPANDGTSIAAETRSRIDGEIEKVRAERLEAERVETMRRLTEIKASTI